MELKDVLGLLQIEASEELTLDQVKQQLDDRFIEKANAHENKDVQSKIIGKHFNRLRQGMQKAFNVEEDFLKDDEGKLMDPHDAFAKISKKVTDDIAEVKENAGKGKDKRVAELEAALEQVKSESSGFEKMNKELSQKLEQNESEFIQKLSSFKVKSKMTDITKTFKLVDDLAPATRRGIQAEIDEDYKWDLNEKGDLIVRNKEGEPIPSEDKASTAASAEEVLTAVYKNNKALKLNNAEKKEKKTIEADEGNDGKIKIAPRRTIHKG